MAPEELEGFDELTPEEQGELRWRLFVDIWRYVEANREKALSSEVDRFIESLVNPRPTSKPFQTSNTLH